MRIPTIVTIIGIIIAVTAVKAGAKDSPRPTPAGIPEGARIMGTLDNADRSKPRFEPMVDDSATAV